MKPSDFLLGLLDFFAILLPGAVTAWIATRYLDAGDVSQLLSLGGGPLPPEARWAAFLIAAYTFGHFVFMIGSGLDCAYDDWRQWAKPVESDRTFKAALRVQRQVRGPRLGVTLLKWAKSYLQLHAPGARLDIDRLEASEKFFRSFVVVSAALAVHFVVREQHPGLALASAIMAGLSYRRFIDQRWKATELVYTTVAILGVVAPKAGGAEAPGALPAPPPP